MLITLNVDVSIGVVTSVVMINDRIEVKQSILSS